MVLLSLPDRLTQLCPQFNVTCFVHWFVFSSLSRTLSSLPTEIICVNSVSWCVRHRHSTSGSPSWLGHKGLRDLLLLYSVFPKAYCRFCFPVDTALLFLLLFLDNHKSLLFSIEKKFLLFLFPALRAFPSYLRPVWLNPSKEGALPEPRSPGPTLTSISLRWFLPTRGVCLGSEQECKPSHLLTKLKAEKNYLLLCSSPIDTVE